MEIKKMEQDMVHQGNYILLIKRSGRVISLEEPTQEADSDRFTNK